MNFLDGNYVDLIILLVFTYFAVGAFRFGFIQLVADSISFLLSLFVSFKIYPYIGDFFKLNFDLSDSLSSALGFLATTVLLEVLFGNVIYLFIKELPKKIRDSKANKVLGLIPASIEGLVFIAFMLSLFVSFPVRPDVKKDVLDSKIGGAIIERTTVIEKSINRIFGGVIEESLTYLAVHPKSNESVDIGIHIDRLSEDPASEKGMFELVNNERQKAGVSKLTWDERIVPVSRAYARDMWERGYFSHYSPEGEDVGDRLKANNIKYQVAGENLARTPTLSIAHTGLMNSEGHRANILSPEFKKIGIGVIDNGVYGKIFVQVFTN